MAPINLKQIILWAQDEAQLIKKLQEFGAIPNDGNIKCEICGEPMNLWFNKRRSDWHWICNRMSRVPHKKKSSCNQRVSVKETSVFEGSHLNFEQILIFIHEWVHYSEVRKMSLEAEIGSHSTAAIYNKFCTEVIVNACIANSTPIGIYHKDIELKKMRVARAVRCSIYSINPLFTIHENAPLPTSPPLCDFN